MKEHKSITIGRFNKNKDELIAFFKHEFLQSTFSVSFKDNITGAVALHSFIDMLQNKYNSKDFELIISKENLNFKTEHILKGLTVKEKSN